MNHIEFIEKNIKQVLVNEGFTVPLALGGGETRGRVLQAGIAGQQEGSDV